MKKKERPSHESREWLEESLDGMLPKKLNASYGDLTYDQKRPHYNGQNILARTLCDAAYDHNPGLKQFIVGTGVALRPHADFKKADLVARQAPYLEMAKSDWSPTLIQSVMEATP